MLSPEKLLRHKKKEVPAVFSLGLKTLALQGTEDEEYHLNAKLENMRQLLSMERVKMYGTMSKAVWQSNLKMAEVTEKSGSFWDVMGHAEHSKYYLYPEEALYLLDVGALEITYRDVPLSLQRAYCLLLDNTGVHCNHYRVYSHLSLLGYNVQRHSRKNVLSKYEKELDVHKIGIKLKDCPGERLSLKKSKRDRDPKSTIKDSISEFFVALNESDETTLSRLRVIPPAEFPVEEGDIDKFINYDVYLENSRSGSFRKSVLQLPTYRIRIVSMNDPVPDIATTVRLHQYFEDEVPIVYAIVHPDFIQFMQVAPVKLPTLL